MGDKQSEKSVPGTKRQATIWIFSD